jgi:hypothetical protein
MLIAGYFFEGGCHFRYNTIDVLHIDIITFWRQLIAKLRKMSFAKYNRKKFLKDKMGNSIEKRIVFMHERFFGWVTYSYNKK